MSSQSPPWTLTTARKEDLAPVTPSHPARTTNNETEPQMPSDHTRLVSDYINAVGEGRLDQLSTHLATDVTFQGPRLPSTHGLDAYTAAPARRQRPLIYHRQTLDLGSRAFLFRYVRKARARHRPGNRP